MNDLGIEVLKNGVGGGFLLNLCCPLFVNLSQFQKLKLNRNERNNYLRKIKKYFLRKNKTKFCFWWIWVPHGYEVNIRLTGGINVSRSIKWKYLFIRDKTKKYLQMSNKLNIQEINIDLLNKKTSINLLQPNRET